MAEILSAIGKPEVLPVLRTITLFVHGMCFRFVLVFFFWSSNSLSVRIDFLISLVPNSYHKMTLTKDMQNLNIKTSMKVKLKK